MKYTKLVLAGLTAVLVLNGATAVFAEDIAEEDTQDSTAIQQTVDRFRNEFRKMTGTGEEEDMPEIDMSGLDLPEDFVPFDEAHVPDGLHAPENGEIKPVEFDEEGNMIYGQRPDGKMPPMNGERPERPDGERPELSDGERPELPDGELPELPDGELSDSELPKRPGGRRPPMNGERPELPDGEMPELPDGEMPELPDGETPELPNGEMGLVNGERPEFSDGELPELPDGEMPELPGNGTGPMMNGQAPQDMQTGQGFPMMNGQGAQPFGSNA